MNQDPLQFLGQLTPQQFLSEHWQQKPLLVRQAVPNYTSPISAEELAGLALEREIESRIVDYRAGEWLLRQGPFKNKDFVTAPDNDWSLLVQAVDLWVPEVAELRQHLHFLPPWRFDDIMVSYAAPGGSVGPHFDHYDVFLLQVEGQREWKIGGPCRQNAPLREASEINVLQQFEATQEWVLEPGDMLYLPPKISHWGTALSDCLTYSIGFRAPTLVEMLDDLIIETIAQERDAYYQDPPMSTDMAQAAIDPAFIQQAQRLLRDLIDDEERLGSWFAQYMTRPKYQGLLELSGELRQAEFNNQSYTNGERD